MAYTSCVSDLTKNIVTDCLKPIVGGYTGRAVLIQWDTNPTIVADATNGRIIRSITSSNTIAVDNAFVTPFDGSSTTSNADTGRPTYTKQISLRVPQRGAEASASIIEPLLKNGGGYLMILEKKDKSVDGAFEVVGYLNPLRATGDGTSRNENENGGDTTIMLETTEPFFEVTLVAQESSADSYNATLTMFETLFNAGGGE